MCCVPTNSIGYSACRTMSKCLPAIGLTESIANTGTPQQISCNAQAGTPIDSQLSAQLTALTFRQVAVQEVLACLTYDHYVVLLIFANYALSEVGLPAQPAAILQWDRMAGHDSWALFASPLLISCGLCNLDAHACIAAWSCHLCTAGCSITSVVSTRRPHWSGICSLTPPLSALLHGTLTGACCSWPVTTVSYLLAASFAPVSSVGVPAAFWLWCQLAVQ